VDIDLLAVGISGLLGLLGIKALFSGFDDDDDDDDIDGEGSPIDLMPGFAAYPS
tara:strand:+ start:83 stop:244 length:162 start_codon:yes stop_codon:yes gene_type:complete